MDSIINQPLDFFHHKKVLVSADLDVPLDKNGWVKDNYRLIGVAQTVSFLVNEGAVVILVGHLKRPEGQIVESLRLDPVADALDRMLPLIDVLKVNDITGPQVLEQINSLEKNQVLMLENIRFHPGEKDNDTSLVKELAEMADYFVNENFSTSHRKQASVYGVSRVLPSFMGIRFAEEVHSLLSIKENPCRPLYFLIGGIKESKLDFAEKVSSFADGIMLSHSLTVKSADYRFGCEVWRSLDEREGRDIGPQTEKLFADKIRQAGTIVWSGPMGKFEEEAYAHGSFYLAEVIAQSDGFSLAGGGDTLSVLDMSSQRDNFDFCSTGGGAMLSLLSEGTLPFLE